MSKPLSIGVVAARCGVPAWQIRQTIKKGYFPEPAKAGSIRIFSEQDVPRLRHALAAAGFRPTTEPAGAAC